MVFNLGIILSDWCSTKESVELNFLTKVIPPDNKGPVNEDQEYK